MTSQNVCKNCEVEQVFECDECVTFSDHCFKEELQGRWIAIMKLESSHKKDSFERKINILCIQK